MGFALNSTAGNEPFPLMRFMIFNVTAKTHKKIKVSAIIIFLWLIFCQIASFFSMTKFDFAQVFATSIYLCFFIALTGLTFIMDIEHLTKCKKRNYWQLDRAGLQLKKDIFKLSRTLEVFWLICISILTMWTIPYFVTPEFLRRADYSIVLVGKYVPYLEPIYLIFLILFITLAAPFCMSWILYFLYFSWHVQLQVFMLTKFVGDLRGNVAEDFCTSHCGVVLDRYCQRNIWRDLIFIIHRHTEVLRYNREVMQYLRTNVNSVLLATSCTCLFLSGIWIAILEHQVRPGTLLLVSLTVLEILCFSAQAHEDRFLAIYYLALEAPWYDWNIKNRKAYLLLIQQSARVVPYQFFNTRVNRKFQLKFLKTVYSVLSLLVNFY